MFAVAPIHILSNGLFWFVKDVNNLRDNSLSSGNETPGELQGIDSISLVKSELESIRMIVRRVDVQNSVEVGIFEKVAGDQAMKIGFKF